MNKQDAMALALSFMADHPRAAVKVLEQSETAAVAELLSSAPVNYITPVLKYILPENAARICEILDPEKAASILSTLDANAVSVIIRLLNSEKKAAIMESLPASLRTRTNLLLEYPLNTAGAWMTPHLLVVANDLKNKNVLKYVKSGSNKDDSKHVYVSDRDGTLLGRTRLLDILKAGENLSVTSTMEPCPAVHALVLLDQIKNHRAWKDADALPVTDRDNRLLGILQHHALRRGLAQVDAGRKKNVAGKDPVSGLLEIYGKSLLAVFNSVSDAMEKDY